MLFFLSFYSSKNPEKKYHVSNIDNKSAYYYDFWRSCDTEDWSNDALHHRDKWLKSIKIENCYFKL